MCVTAVVVVVPLKLSGQKRAVHLKKGCQLNVIRMGLIFVGCGLLFIVCVLICTLPVHLLRIREKTVRQKKKKKSFFCFFFSLPGRCVSFVLWRQLGVSHFHRLLCNIILFRERRPPRIIPFLRVTAHTVDRVSLFL